MQLPTEECELRQKKLSMQNSKSYRQVCCKFGFSENTEWFTDVIINALYALYVP